MRYLSNKSVMSFLDITSSPYYRTVRKALNLKPYSIPGLKGVRYSQAELESVINGENIFSGEVVLSALDGGRQAKKKESRANHGTSGELSQESERGSAT